MKAQSAFTSNEAGNGTKEGPDGSLAAPLAPANGARRLLQEFKTDILIVDDREDKLLALEAALISLGQRIVKARSGKEALRRLLRQQFAVILLDVSMPVMDGFETAALIRQRLSSEHTPIIFITAIGGSENHITRGYSLGAVDYIMAPIMPEVLRTKVSVFVELHRNTETIRRQAERLRQDVAARKAAEDAAIMAQSATATARAQNVALMITQAFGFLAVLAGLLWKGYSESRDRRWAREDAQSNHQSVIETLGQVKDEAHAAYKEANTVNAKIATIGMQMKDGPAVEPAPKSMWGTGGGTA